MKERIVIANASGYWGDEGAAIRRQVTRGPIDYLTLDYLAEITMIILSRQRAKSEDAGYARDFVFYLAGILEEVAKRGITVISNAGGINPGACARAIEELVRSHGLDLPVAVVDGDDLMPALGKLVERGADFRHLDTGEPLGERIARVTCANAYLGARPIVAALERGARIVVTGRTYDAASVLAPMVHEFGWDWSDYDRLASGLLAGHLIECGAQATGGNYTDWREVPSYREMGYPLVEVSPDGGFVLTKHPGTGGLVSTKTATEQILYEIGDPRAYRSPDVISDFTSFRLEQEGPDRVRVRGVRGRPPSDQLKVSIAYADGFKLVTSVVVSGPDAVAKARTFADILWGRIGDGLTDKRTDLIGYDACWGASASPPCEPNEVVLRLAAKAAEQKPLEKIARELAGIALSGPAGICGGGGRPEVSPAFGFWPALIPRSMVTARTFIGGQSVDVSCDQGEAAEPDLPGEAPMPPAKPAAGRERVRLARVAFARSGDKGDICNVGVAARSPALYGELLREVTAEKVAAFFASNVHGRVRRYRLDNLHAMNFVMEDALGGGGTTSLLLDHLGKTIAQGLLQLEVDIDAELLKGL